VIWVGTIAIIRIIRFACCSKKKVRRRRPRRLGSGMLAFGRVFGGPSPWLVWVLLRTQDVRGLKLGD